MESLRGELSQVEQPVVVEIGAGTAIPTVRRFGESLDCPLIRINRQEPDVQRTGDVAIPLGGLEALRAISKALDLA